MLVFTSNPPPILVLNATFSVEVTARDAQGATATAFSAPISLTLEGPVVAGGLSGTTTVNAVNGVATFSDLHIDRTGTTYTLVAKAAGLTDGETGAFNILP